MTQLYNNRLLGNKRKLTADPRNKTEESSVKSSSGEGTHGLCSQLLKILENEFQQQWLPEKGMSGAGGEKEKGVNKRQEETEG